MAKGQEREDGTSGKALVYNSKGYGYAANADQLGQKKKAELRTDLSKLAAGGDAVEELIKEDASGEDGNQAYTGMLGKSGYSSKNNKVVRKFAALPPPGHEQWDMIPGNENLYDEGIENECIIEGIDTSIAHIPAVGQNFKPDKRGVKVCNMWKRGMCNFGDRCIYNHGEVLHKPKFQDVVDANIAPDERDKFGYRIAKQHAVHVGSAIVPQVSDQQRKLDDTTDWYSSDSKEVNLKSEDMNVIKQSIEKARDVVGMLETDFTAQPKKKSRWN